MTTRSDEAAAPRGAAPVPAGGLRQALSALKIRDFRLIWFAAFVSTSGTWMQTIAQAWVVLELTGSAFWLGVDAFLATLPMILFSLFGGVLADRLDRRHIMIASQILQMLPAIVLAVLLATGTAEVWHILVLSFWTGSVQALAGPAYQAILPSLVGPEHVQNAVALNSLQFNLARMVGPVLAGLALASLGAVWCFALNAVSFLPVIAAVLMITGLLPVQRKQRRSVGEEMKEGIRFVIHDSAAGELTLLAFATAFLGMPLVTLLPVVARDVFGLGADGYGWMMTASGAGSVAGAVMVAAFGNLRYKARVAIGCQAVFAAAMIVFALSNSVILSGAVLVITGASMLGVATLISSLVQLVATNENRGRVMSIFMMAFRGGMPLGNLAAGWLAESRGVRFALIANALVLLALSALVRFTPNRVRDR